MSKQDAVTHRTIKSVLQRRNPTARYHETLSQQVQPATEITKLNKLVLQRFGRLINTIQDTRPGHSGNSYSQQILKIF